MTLLSFLVAGHSVGRSHAKRSGSGLPPEQTNVTQSEVG